FLRQRAPEQEHRAAHRASAEVGDVNARGVEQEGVDLALDDGVVDEILDGAFFLVQGFFTTISF
ncbi:MAG TPA: hypothetical protein QGG32_04155, partial [Rhodospirillales bacterium]|nr:hypothetical protein [Rhodospirillales bacterium]